jgi:3-hydroxyisobutyrate dehydrogenase
MEDPKILNVVWVGTGVMGSPMCKFLLARPDLYRVSIHNRTQSRTDELVSMGATWVDLAQLQTPNTFDIMILMVLGPPEVENLLITENLIQNLPEGAVIIDHTSSSPALARKLASAASQRNIFSIDAPVSGGDTGAQNGTLQIMAGGSNTGFDKAKPIMEKYSKSITHMGAAGFGQHTKIANQILLVANIQGFCESYIYALKAELNLEIWYEIISTGSARNFIINWIGPRVMAGDFNTGFAAALLVKDLEMGLDECRLMGISLPNAALMHQMYRGLLSGGDTHYSVQGLVQVYLKLNGLQNK